MSQSLRTKFPIFITAAAPIVTYINADQAKLKILKENASKSGVYLVETRIPENVILEVLSTCQEDFLVIIVLR